MGIECIVIDKPSTVGHEWKQGDLFIIENKEECCNPKVVWIVTTTIAGSIYYATCLGDGTARTFPPDFGKFIPVTPTNTLLFKKME